MKHARTIAMATTLLADGRAGAVVDMVEPLLESVSPPAASTGQILLRGLLARVDVTHRDRPERVFDLLPDADEVTELCTCVRAEVALWRGWAHARRADTTDEAARALRHLDDGQELFTSICNPVGRSWALLGRARAYSALEEYGLMRRVLDDATTLLDRLQDTQANRWFHELSTTALRLRGQYKEAAAHADTLRSIAADWADRRIQGHAAAHTAALRHDRGDSPAAVLEASETALYQLSPARPATRAALCRALRARVGALCRQERWADAQSTLQEAAASALDVAAARPFLRAQQARVALDREEAEAAISILDETFERRLPTLATVRRAGLAFLYCRAFAAADRPDDAQQWLQRALRTARETGHCGLEQEALRVRDGLDDPAPAPAHSSAPSDPAAAVDGFVAESREMQAVADTLRRIQPSHSPVLITGERGAGKRLVARAVHATSRRAGGPLKRISCAPTQTEEPLDAKLFGDGGSATGAVHAAQGGTLLIEDVEALPARLQSSLLRLLSAEGLSSEDTGAPDVRIVATTTADLGARVEEGRFASGLWDRLGAISLHVPPLRERRPDIPLLARHFLNELRPPGSSLVSITEPALEALLRYNWPGNVRQLRNEIERALVHVRSEPAPTVDLDTLHNAIVEGAQQNRSPQPPQDAPDAILDPDQTLSDVLARTEKAVIERVLRACDGQVTASADVLGLTRQGLYKKMKRLDIDASSFQSSTEAAPTP